MKEGEITMNVYHGNYTVIEKIMCHDTCCIIFFVYCFAFLWPH